MPACFQLTKKGETTPSRLDHIDEEIARHLMIAPDPTYYVRGWYDSIGFRLAIGQTFEQIIAEFQASKEEHAGDSTYEVVYDDMIKIAKFLDENYTTDAFYQHGMLKA